MHDISRRRGLAFSGLCLMTEGEVGFWSFKYHVMDELFVLARG